MITFAGVIANSLYGSSLFIWDHGMLWREKIKVCAYTIAHFALTVTISGIK